MQQFIPFEDDWDALEKLLPEALIPYRVGYVPAHEPASHASPSAPTAVSVPLLVPEAANQA
ncbi:hypothetical protein EKH79_17135 [Dyella dinghuensis]|uniref:Uncharacterized protein n=1 Tax=Dyella dinghuensis TaxID=1920169 RepID=A0A432LP41_9GAMM|nr:hypothetical protein [Dyella dinghuensis]RUL61364.1 hypothetical protein EKH79_17135 [Dyella dinghuensis]